MAEEPVVGRLVSVNVGLPKDVEWRGRTVRTGIWKAPVAGPVMARRLNLDGDGQGDTAGHGGEQRAVMVYQLDSYRHWERELGRDDFGFGQFGENLTVDGLPDDEVCVGDRYRIGGAVFEVTQPRVTCFRVGIRMDEPRMAALLVSHRRPGFYLRVIEEGEVAAGQDIRRISTGPGRMPVTEVDALLYLRERPRDRIEAALRIGALSPGWRTSFEALLAQEGRGAASGNAGLSRAGGVPAPAWTGFRKLRVAEVREESREVRSLWLADPAGRALPAALPGQFVTLRLAPDGGGAALIRSYSLSGRPGADRYRISVKAEPHGTVSGRLHTRVRVGDVLDVAAPRGAFLLGEGSGPVLLASAGVGATPVLAMLQQLAATGSGRRVWWLHGARDGAEHVFAAESRDLLARLPHARAVVCYSRPRPEDRRGVDYTETGRLTGAVLDRIGLDLAGLDAYLCGPAAFMADLSAALTARGLAPERLHTEIFGAAPGQTPGIAARPSGPPHPPEGRPGTGPSVSFARSGLTVPWDDSRASLLELAEACDVPVRWSCRTGVCHTCEIALLAGTVAYAPDPVEPPADGDVLTCCSRPVEDVVLDL